MQGYGTPAASTSSTRSRSRLYVGGWLLLLRRSAPALGGPRRRSPRGGCSRGLPEGHRLEHALRGARPRLRQRTAHRALLPADRRLPLLPAPGHHQAAALRRAARCSAARTRRGSTSRSTCRARRRRCARCSRPSSTPRAPAARGAGAAPGRRRQDALPRRARRALLGRRSCASSSPATGSPGPRRCSWRSGSGPAISKLNHHFPAVVVRDDQQQPVHALRVAAPAHVPRLSRATCAPRGSPTAMAHAGTALEIGRAARVPARASRRRRTVLGLVLMLMLHVFITSNVPHGRAHRVERHRGLRRLRALLGAPRRVACSARPCRVAAFLVVMLVVLPLRRQPLPRAVSFLLRHALLRRQLGLLRLALPRRQLPQARPAHEERALGPRPARPLLRPRHGGRALSAR